MDIHIRIPSRRVSCRRPKSTDFQSNAILYHPRGATDNNNNEGEQHTIAYSRRKISNALFLLATTAALPAGAVLPSPSTGSLIDTTIKIIELDSGVSYRDLVEGKVEDGIAVEGKRVNIQWVLKRNNGYSIDSSSQNDSVPFIFVVGGNNKSSNKIKTAIPGLDEGIRGMKVGGIRRIVIPPALAYVGGLDDSTSPGPVPNGFGPKQRIKRVMENRIDVPDESFLLDVKLTRVQ